MAWMNNDQLYIRYGTDKATPTTAGDYLKYGEYREIEFTLTLANLTTTPTPVGNTTFLPSGVFVEEVEVDTEVAGAGGTSISVGTMRSDRSTAISNTAILNAQVLASHDAAGEKNAYNVPAAGGGGSLLGTTTSFTDNFAYITALAAGTYTAGVVKVRIKYRGIGTITQ